MTNEQKDRDEKVAWKFRIDTALTKLGFVQEQVSDIATGEDIADMQRQVKARNPTLFIGYMWRKESDFVYYTIPEGFQRQPNIDWRSTFSEKELLNKDGR